VRSYLTLKKVKTPHYLRHVLFSRDMQIIKKHMHVINTKQIKLYNTHTVVFMPYYS